MLSNGFDNASNWDFEFRATDDVRIDEAIDLAWQRDEALAWAQTHDRVADHLFDAGDYTGSSIATGQSLNCGDIAGDFQAGIDDLGMADFGF